MALTYASGWDPPRRWHATERDDPSGFYAIALCGFRVPIALRTAADLREDPKLCSFCRHHLNKAAS